MGLTKPRAAQIFNLDYKQSTRVVTTTNITLTGGAPSLVDGVSLSTGDRVLVTAQTTASQNGLYLVATLGSGSNGTWGRTSDGNENGEIEAGMIVMVTEGVIYADTQWKLITDDPITIGTTALTFTQNYMANSISSGTSNVVVTSNANVTVSSAGTANVLTITSTGTVTVGTVSVTGNITGGNLTVSTGTITVGSIVNANANAVGNIGSSSNYFNTVFAKATSAQYADLAEMYSADAEYAPGTVVKFGGVQEITITSSGHCTQVAGIVSTNPSYLMNSAQAGDYVVPVALTGRVPCLVMGTITKGDRLVSSNIAGVATALDKTLYEPGCIVGKALEKYQSNQVGTIEVAVGRF